MLTYKINTANKHKKDSGFTYTPKSLLERKTFVINK